MSALPYRLLAVKPDGGLMAMSIPAGEWPSGGGGVGGDGGGGGSSGLLVFTGAEPPDDQPDGVFVATAAVVERVLLAAEFPPPASGALEEWTAIASLSAPQASGAGFSIGPAGYFCGGALVGAAITAASRRYDPVSDTWTSIAGLPAAKYSATAFSVGGAGYVCGGMFAGSAVVATGHGYIAEPDSGDDPSIALRITLGGWDQRQVKILDGSLPLIAAVKSVALLQAGVLSEPPAMTNIEDGGWTQL